jgi:hypothetical protein
MPDMLDVRFDMKYDSTTEKWSSACWVWDGPMYVASKEWIDGDPAQLVREMPAFWLYWSRLYYDNPELTAEPKNELGLVQRRLWRD